MLFRFIEQKAKQLKEQLMVIYFVSRDSRLPWYVKVLAVIVTAYVFSPIDLIPDFIPVLGLLDDIILVPLGLALIIKLTPSDIIESARIQAQHSSFRPVNYWAAALILLIWVSLLFIVGYWFYAWLY